VALIRTDVSEDRIASIFRVHECELVTERIIRKAIEIELHPHNMNREEGFCLSKSWKPLICTLKYPGK
jgi:hypothetical protein